MRLFRATVVFLLVASLSGCVTTSWHQTYALPEDLDARHPERLRLTMTDGTTLMVHRPDVRADSIVGLAADGASRVAVATPDVARVEVPSRHLSEGGRTARDAGLGVGGAVVGAIVIVGVLGAVLLTQLGEGFMEVLSD